MRNASPSVKHAAGLTSRWTPLTHPAGKGDSSLKEGPERRTPRAQAAAGSPSPAAPRRWRRGTNTMTSGTQGGGWSNALPVPPPQPPPPPSPPEREPNLSCTQTLPNKPNYCKPDDPMALMNSTQPHQPLCSTTQSQTPDQAVPSPKSDNPENPKAGRVINVVRGGRAIRNFVDPFEGVWRGSAGPSP